MLVFLLGSMSAFFSKFVCFLVGFGDSLAQSSEELWRSQNSCLSGADFWHFSGPKCQRIMAFPKFMSFWVGFFFAFLWSKVPKNDGVPEIRVFLGRIFLAFLWSKVLKNHGVPEICVFLHPEMLEFRGVGELSCWGHTLKIEC